MIEFFVIIAFAISLKYLMKFQNENVFVFEILRYSGALLPVILIIFGVLKNDGITIIFAGICFFWFPLMERNK